MITLIVIGLVVVGIVAYKLHKANKAVTLNTVATEVVDEVKKDTAA